MKNIVLISASPKPSSDSVSRWLVARASEHISTTDNKKAIDVRQSLTSKNIADDFDAISKADAIILAFPLYFFCLPGMLMRFLQDYTQYRKENNIEKKPTSIYTLVNCGFTEPEINLEAVRVVESFARTIGANFRFGIMLGGGGMLLGAQSAPPVKKAFIELDAALDDIAKDIQIEAPPLHENVQITIKFPRMLYHLMGGLGWISQARKNRLKKKDLYRKPYALSK